MVSKFHVCDGVYDAVTMGKVGGVYAPESVLCHVENGGREVFAGLDGWEVAYGLDYHGRNGVIESWCEPTDEAIAETVRESGHRFLTLVEVLSDDDMDGEPMGYAVIMSGELTE